VHVNLEDVKRRSFFFIFAASLSFAFCFVGCSREPRQSPAAPAVQGGDVGSQPPNAASEATPPPAASEDNRPVVVAFGDSLTAGVVPHSYPEYLQGLLDKAGYTYRVENQGVSGDTTTDGLARIGNVVAVHPALVILEFGGNDGLRGIPVDSTKATLRSMVSQLKAAGIPVVLAGITLPPNYGPDYVKPFTAMFGEVAKDFDIRLLPFLLLHVYQHPDLMQPDGIHPNDAGNKIVAQDVFQFIQPLLRRSASARE
jgi:acyl-CoA thioesterase-1